MHALWVVIDNIFFRAIADIACLKVRGDYFHETFTERIEKVKKLEPLATGLDISMAQLALAWCLKNPKVSTVIMGASRVTQVHENLKALEAVEKLTPEILAAIETILGNRPEEDD